MAAKDFNKHKSRQFLVTDQLDAHFFYVFVSILYMFRATSCSSSGDQLHQYNIWYMSLCVGDRFMCRSPTSRHETFTDTRVTFTRCCIDTIDSPDEHEFARNM